MPPTIVETPAASNANSYASLVEAEAYVATRLYSDAWADADDAEQKIPALIQATRILDGSFVWTGVASTDVQALGWPRTGMLNRNGFPINSLVIPQPLKDAQVELAVQMIIAERTADNDAEKQGIKSLSAGPVSLTFKDKKLETDQDLLLRGPEFLYLSPFIPDAVTNLLVPSWYVRPTLTELASPLIFDTL